jgi:transcriptional regulator with XRE-family HTH domain
MPGQGAQLKAIRLDLGFKTRDVERLSREIADTKGNSEFYISHGWLTQIENSELTPSIYKLYSLSAIYRLKYARLLDLYGISLDDLGKDQIRTAVPRTHLLDLEPPSVENKIEFPVSLSPGLSLGETNLLGKMVESWGQVPVELIRTLDLRRVTYGYIGSEDRTMYPLIRPGSFVEIDERLRKIDSTPSIVENDRPIYFLALRNGYACGWCEVNGSQLSLIPHQSSQLKTRRFAYPEDVTVLGRVVAVAMRLVDSAHAPKS